MAERPDRWGGLAWADTKFRYRRTLLGPFWITLSMATLVFSVGLVYGTLFGAELSSYLPYFGCGIIIWTYISSIIVEGCNVFVSSSGIIKSVPVPLTLHIFRLLARQIIILLHNAILILLLWIVFRWELNWGMLLAVLGLLITTSALLGIVLALSIFCTRFRDIERIIGAIIQLLFLITPIMWMPESLRGAVAAPVLLFNPFYYLIEIVRGPLLGAPPSAAVWSIAILSAAFSLLIGLGFYARFRHRVAYWL